MTPFLIIDANYRRFGLTCWNHLLDIINSTLKMETAVHQFFW